MTRKRFLACLLGASFAGFSIAQPPVPSGQQEPAKSEPPPASDQPPAINPDDLPEEDESQKPRTYAFNPLEAERNIKVGEFYMRQGTNNGYRAAAGRFEDATKYNPGSAEAFLKLGEAQAKLKHKDKAKNALEQAIKLAPGDSKTAKDARKKLAQLG